MLGIFKEQKPKSSIYWVHTELALKRTAAMSHFPSPLLCWPTWDLHPNPRRASSPEEQLLGEQAKSLTNGSIQNGLLNTLEVQVCFCFLACFRINIKDRSHPQTNKKSELFLFSPSVLLLKSYTGTPNSAVWCHLVNPQGISKQYQIDFSAS